MVSRSTQPKIDAIHKQAAEARARIEASVPDKKEQQRQLKVIDDNERDQTQALNDVAAMGSRQRLPESR